MPGLFARRGENPHVEAGRIDQSNPLAPGKWGQDVIHVGNHEIVAAVTENSVNRHRLCHPQECLEWVARNADESRFSLLLDLAHRRDSLIDDLFYIAELNVVRLEQIQIVGLKAPQRLANATGNSLGREVE